MEINKDSLEKDIKMTKRRLGITRGITYLNGILAVCITGDGIYRLAEGDYKLALIDAGLAIFSGYIAYDHYKFSKGRQERLKNKQSQLESIVAEDKDNQ